MERTGQRVGQRHRTTVFIFIGLHTTSAGNVVFAGGEFKIAAIGQLAGLLHQSLAIGILTKDDGAVVVLQGTSRNLCCRSRLETGQDDNGHIKVERRVACLERGRVFSRLGTHIQHLFAFGQKQIDHIHRCTHHAAGIVAQVENELSGALALQVGHGQTHFATSLLDITAQHHIAHTVGQHRGASDTG